MYKCVKQSVCLIDLLHKIDIKIGNISNNNDWISINIKWFFSYDW